VFYDTFKVLCEKKGVSCKRAVTEMGFSNSLATKWKNTGATPQGETLSKIADYFGVSVDYLLGTEQQKTPGLTKKDERDIAKELERMRESLESGQALMFDGDPMSSAARESILAAMKLGLEAAKKMNKETYTPKKYRKG